MLPRAYWVVARREYGEGVRSRWFILTCLLGPLVLAGVVAFSAWIQSQGHGKTTRVALIDETTESSGPYIALGLGAKDSDGVTRYAVETLPAGTDLAAVKQRIDRGELDGYLVLPKDLAAGGEIVYRGTNASSTFDMAILGHTLQIAVEGARARTLGIRDADATALLAPIHFDARQATAGEESSGIAAFAVAYIVSFLLYFSTLMYSASVMRSVVQEKSSRVMEIIVACARPGELMLGKVLGIGLLGLTQMLTWVILGAVAMTLKVQLLGHALGASAASAIPSIGAGQVVLIVLFFLGGYFLYAGMFAAIGAANDNERDAQQATMPVVMLLTLCAISFPVVASSPRAALPVALSIIPFTSPIIMPMRAMLTPVPAWQIALSAVTLAASVYFAIVLAARIFRVGILMYGKRTTMRELLRWLR